MPMPVVWSEFLPVMVVLNYVDPDAYVLNPTLIPLNISSQTIRDNSVSFDPQPILRK